MTIDATSVLRQVSAQLSGNLMSRWRGVDPAAAAMDTTDTPALSYSAESHGTHADFCRSAHFVQYQEQVREPVLPCRVLPAAPARRMRTR